MALPMLGVRLRRLREQRKLTQHELADLCEIHSKQIWRYENGQAEPTATHLAQIAHSLSVSADFLLGLVDEEAIRYFERPLDSLEQKLIEFLRYQPDEHRKLGVPFTVIIEQHVSRYTEILTYLTILFKDRQQIIAKLYNLAPYAEFTAEDE